MSFEWVNFLIEKLGCVPIITEMTSWKGLIIRKMFWKKKSWEENNHLTRCIVLNYDFHVMFLLFLSIAYFCRKQILSYFWDDVISISRSLISCEEQTYIIYIFLAEWGKIYLIGVSQYKRLFLQNHFVQFYAIIYIFFLRKTFLSPDFISNGYDIYRIPILGINELGRYKKFMNRFKERKLAAKNSYLMKSTY